MLFNLQLTIVGIVHCIHDPLVVLVCKHNDKGDDIDTFFLTLMFMNANVIKYPNLIIGG
jgi:uncharacterized membrane protein